ncbi:MAG: hypothetical protein AAGN35_11605 [Bacteroidota bacterium]
MSQEFSNDLAPGWVLQRVLDFLNRAQSPKDITEGVQDDPQVTTGDAPTGTPGYGIGATVAQRIIDHRNALPRRRFSRITELNGIQGLGPDKAHDLLYSLGKSADEAFKQGMYNGVVFPANFDLEYHYVHFVDDESFRQVVEEDSVLTRTVSQLLFDAVLQRTQNRPLASTAKNYLPQCFLEHTRSAHQASYYFAYWFYRFDSDNWFSFDRVRQETEKYLEYNWRNEDRLELKFYKGFDQNGLLAEAITVEDLPVVINYGERRVTIWGAGLRD